MVGLTAASGDKFSPCSGFDARIAFWQRSSSTPHPSRKYHLASGFWLLAAQVGTLGGTRSPYFFSTVTVDGGLADARGLGTVPARPPGVGSVQKEGTMVPSFSFGAKESLFIILRLQHLSIAENYHHGRGAPPEVSPGQRGGRWVGPVLTWGHARLARVRKGQLGQEGLSDGDSWLWPGMAVPARSFLVSSD